MKLDYFSLVLVLTCAVVLDTTNAFGQLEELYSSPGLGQPTDAPAAEPSDMKFFALEHADAVATATLMQQLFREPAKAPALECVADSRTNTLIVRGQPAVIKEIEAVINLIDQAQPAKASSGVPGTGARPAPGKMGPGGGDSMYGSAMGDSGAMSGRGMMGPGGGDSMYGSAMGGSGAMSGADMMNAYGAYPTKTPDRTDIDSLKEKQRQAEQRAAKTARQGIVIPGELQPSQYRWRIVIPGELRPSHDPNAAAPGQDTLRSSVRREVEAAFEARQQLQRAELQQLREQHARIERTIDARERIKDKIIDRRVEELLDPNLRWDGVGVADQPITTATNDASEIQGHWRMDRLLMPGGRFGTPVEVQDLIVAGETWTISSQDKSTTGVLLVDPTCDPKAITFIGETNGGRDRTHAIYRLNDDRLEILTFPDGRAHRPASFDEKNACVQIFKRVVDLSGSTTGDSPVATAQLPLELPAGTWPELEGIWKLVAFTSTESDFDAHRLGLSTELKSMIVRGNRMVRAGRDGQQSEQAFVYDPNATPQTIDFLRVRDGKEYRSQYIIDVSGDTLRLGWSLNGGSERAKSFEAPRVLIMNYQREQIGNTADRPVAGETTVPGPEFKRVDQPVTDELPQQLP